MPKKYRGRNCCGAMIAGSALLGCGRGQKPRRESIPPRFCSPFAHRSRLPSAKCQYGCPPRGRTSRARCRWIFTSEARRIELRGLIMMAHEVFALMARPSQRSGIESRHIPKMGGAGQAACIPRSTHRIIYIGGNWVRGKGEGVVGEQH